MFVVNGLKRRLPSNGDRAFESHQGFDFVNLGKALYDYFSGLVALIIETLRASCTSNSEVGLATALCQRYQQRFFRDLRIKICDKKYLEIATN